MPTNRFTYLAKPFTWSDVVLTHPPMACYAIAFFYFPNVKSAAIALVRTRLVSNVCLQNPSPCYSVHLVVRHANLLLCKLGLDVFSRRVLAQRCRLWRNRAVRAPHQAEGGPAPLHCIPLHSTPVFLLFLPDAKLNSTFGVLTLLCLVLYPQLEIGMVHYPPLQAWLLEANQVSTKLPSHG